MSSSKCTIDHDKFCFIRPGYISRNERPTKGTSFVENYRKKFNIDPKIQSDEWSPNVVCWVCYKKLMQDGREFGNTMVMLKPTMWQEPEKHPDDCYFCNTKIIPKRFNFATDVVEYANVSSVIKPVYKEDTEEMDVTSEETEASTSQQQSQGIGYTPSESAYYTSPQSSEIEERGSQSPQLIQSSQSSESSQSSQSSRGDPSWHPERHYLEFQSQKVKEKVILTQPVLNDIIRDVTTTMEAAEVLASRLRDCGLGNGMYTVFIFFFRKNL